MNFLPSVKTGLLTKFPRDFKDEQTTASTTVASNMQQMENWLVILLLSSRKCHAKQICVLSSSMKLVGLLRCTDRPTRASVGHVGT